MRSICTISYRLVGKPPKRGGAPHEPAPPSPTSRTRARSAPSFAGFWPSASNASGADGLRQDANRGAHHSARARQGEAHRLHCPGAYRHAGSDKRITDDWRRIETIEAAETLAEGARKERDADPRPRDRPKNKSPV